MKPREDYKQADWDRLAATWRSVSEDVTPPPALRTRILAATEPRPRFPLPVQALAATLVIAGIPAVWLWSGTSLLYPEPQENRLVMEAMQAVHAEDIRLNEEADLCGQPGSCLTPGLAIEPSFPAT